MSLRIINLVAENVKKLKAVDITPEGNLVKITGANEQGKSTVLDCIWWAIEGSRNIQKKPIRTGEDSAKIELTLGDSKEVKYIVTRKFTKTNTSGYLTLETKDGHEIKSPQTVLNKLITSLSFDPLGFTYKKPAEQKEEALKFAKNLKEDIPALEAERALIYDERTDVNKEKKKLKNQLEDLEKPDENLPKEELLTSDVLKEMREAQEVIKNNDEERKKLNKLQQKIETLADDNILINEDIKKAELEITELEKRIKRIKQGIKKHKQSISNNEEMIQELTNEEIVQANKVNELEDPDLSKFEEKLEQVEKINKKIRKAKEYNNKQNEYKDLVIKSNRLTEQIKELDDRKDKALQGADFPVPGLSVDDEGLIYKGLPFDQASQEEQLKVSMAMAMAMNPDLRVIRTKNASLLDENNLKVIEKMAEDNDFQIWAELVDTSGKVGVFIEEGEVKKVNSEKTKSSTDNKKVF